MERRRGVAATLTAALVFSILLVSNFALQSESVQDARLAAVAAAEVRISSQALVLEGVAASWLLTGAQSALGADSLPCSGYPDGAWLGGLSTTQTSGNITAHASISGLGDSSLPDNMTFIAPFNGTETGYMDVIIVVRVTGSDSPLGVGFDKVEVHGAHLPVRVAAGAKVCRDSSASLAAALGQAQLSNCTAAEAEQSTSSEIANLTASARASGFYLTFSVARAMNSGCSLVLTTQVAQGNVDGPGGPFTARWSEAVAIQGQT